MSVSQLTDNLLQYKYRQQTNNVSTIPHVTPSQLQTPVRCCDNRPLHGTADTNFIRYNHYRATNTEVMHGRESHFTVCKTTQPNGGEDCVYNIDEIFNTDKTKIGVPDPYGLTKKTVGYDNTAITDRPRVGPTLYAIQNCRNRTGFCSTATNSANYFKFPASQTAISNALLETVSFKGHPEIYAQYKFNPIFTYIVSQYPKCIDANADTETILLIRTSKFMRTPITTYTIKKVIEPRKVEDTDNITIISVVNKIKVDPGLIEITLKTSNEKLLVETYQITLIANKMVLKFNIDTCIIIPPFLQSVIAGNSQATVTWLASSTVGITKYIVQFTDNNGNIISFDEPAVPGSRYTKTYTGLNNNTTYNVTIIAVIDNRRSDSSNMLTVTPIPDTINPPSNVSATSGDLTQTTVTWTAPVSNGSTITGYTITATPSGGGPTITVNTPSLTTTTTITNLTNTTYDISVVANTALGDSNPGTTSATPAELPDPPDNVSATSGEPNQTTVTWDVPPNLNGSTITGYTITATPSGGGPTITVNTPSLTTTITNLTNTTYDISVVANTALGDSNPGTTSATPIELPDPPDNVVATSDELTQTTVTWDVPPNLNGSTITGYTITATPSGGGPTITVNTPSLTTTITNLTNTTYDISVVANTALGDSNPGTTSATPIELPDPPDNVVATSDELTQTTVTWDVPPNLNGSTITGYTITATPSGGGPTITVNTPSLTTTITNLTNTTYDISVVANTALGDSNPGTTSATPIELPDPPLNVSATSGEPNQTTVTWDVPPNLNGSTITGYTITATPIGSGPTITVQSGSLSAIVPGLLGVPYDIFVVANTPLGDSTASVTVTATPADPPFTGTLEMAVHPNKVQLLCGPYPYTGPVMTLKLTIDKPALHNMTIILNTVPNIDISGLPIIILQGATSVDINVQYNQDIYCTFINVPFGPFSIASITPTPLNTDLITNINNAALPSALLTYVEGIFEWEGSTDVPIINTGNSFTIFNVSIAPTTKTVEFYAESLAPGDGLTILNTPGLKNNPAFIIKDFGNVPLEPDTGYQLASMTGTYDLGAGCITYIRGGELKGTFRDSTNFNHHINDWDTSQTTSLVETFYGCTNFNRDLDLWDVSNVTHSQWTFFFCQNFNGNLTTWNLGSLTQGVEMLKFCSSFEQNVSNWGPGSISGSVNIGGMFDICTSFTGQGVTSWSANNFFNISQTFDSCPNFNQDISNWDVSNVTNMIFTFAHTPFNQDINSWDVSSVLHLQGIFFSCTAFNQDLNSWDTSNVTSINQSFTNATVFNGNISNWDVSNVTSTGQTFMNASAFNQVISNWNVSSVHQFTSMFTNATSFNQELSGWTVSTGTDMESMFQGATSFTSDISTWDISNVTDTMAMFQGATSFTSDLGSWDIGSITLIENMFSGATNMAFGDNMSLTLIGWEAYIIAHSGQPANLNINFTNNFPALNSAGNTAKQNLINIHGWT